MGNRLYVGNLSFNTSRETIEAAFAAAGTVREVAMPTDTMTGQARGFAFVTMASDQEASKAIEMLNGSMIDGRVMRVNEAQERDVPPRPGGGRG
jgi:cold-inducible RNA-binding protein